MKKTETMSEEDKKLERELHMSVDKVLKEDPSLYGLALETLRKLIRTSTTSITSVPLPLKFLRNYYLRLRDRCDTIETDEKTKALLCSIVSVLATGQEKHLKDTLRYCLRAGEVDVGDWGHEYVRQLETEIIKEWNNDQENRKKLLSLITSIVAFDIKHNAVIQACDLLMEIDRLDLLQVDKSNYLKICLYLLNCYTYVVEPEKTNIYNEVMKHYLNFGEYPRALCLAMSVNDIDTMLKIFILCQDPVERKQLAFMLGRQHGGIELNDESKDKDDLMNIMSNSHINIHFNNLARELDILEPKTPEDIYGILLNSLVLRPLYNIKYVSLNSSRKNLASTFVNAFVNAGFSSDKLVSVQDGNTWMYNNKEYGMLSAAASLGLIYLWDIDGGLTSIDKCLYTSNEYIKAGALLGLGIVNVGVRNECDPAYSLLSDYVLHDSVSLRIGAVLGLGLAYAGTRRQDVITLLLSVISHNTSTYDVVAFAALSCGMISVGAADPKVLSTILKFVIDLPPEELLGSYYTKFLALAIGFCYLGLKDEAEIIDRILGVLVDPFKSMARITVKMCAYAGSGDVTIIQELLNICSECYTPAPEENNSKNTSDQEENENEINIEITNNDFFTMEAVAAFAIAVVAMGEDIGSEMCLRIFKQLERYEEPLVKRAVPLAIALLSISNPQMNIIDMLNKFRHDLDEEVTQNAIFAMGLVGAGSNNTKLVTILHQLVHYHAKNADNLFIIRIAQGLTYMGKGTISLSPFHTDRQVMNPVALSGLLIPLFSFLDSHNVILEKSHYLLYTLVVAMHPKWLVTLNENLEPLSVLVRVGQAVDVTGKVGTPKTITGAHTSMTPVLLAVGEKAELATNEYKCLTPIMEGIVILRKKPENV